MYATLSNILPHVSCPPVDNVKLQYITYYLPFYDLHSPGQ
jgi:hypothetical protein